MQYQTMEDFIDEFRSRLQDTTCEIDDQEIISWTNTAIRRLARAKGLDKLFTYQDTFELERINSDGTPAATWLLRGKDTTIGTIIDIKSMLLLDSSSCNMCPVEPCYKPLAWFRKEHPFPERECPGAPEAFTLLTTGGETEIMFDRPIPNAYTLDLVYTAFPPRIKSLSDKVYVPYAYADILMEGVVLLYNQAASDYSFARANYEDWDFYVAEARELLAKQPEGFPPRTMRGSF